jgi:hypothetical protein
MGYGARPLKRSLEREFLAPLSEALNHYAENLLARWRVENPAARNVVLDLDLDADRVTVRTTVAE